MRVNTIQATSADTIASKGAVDAEARLALAAIRDSHQDRQQARTERRSARRDRISLMEQSAEKMESMAKNALIKGIVSGVGTMVSQATRSGNMPGLQALDKLLKVFNQLDLLGAANRFLDADKQRLLTEADRADHRVKDAGEEMAAARQAGGDMVNLMTKLAETRRAAEMASVRR